VLMAVNLDTVSTVVNDNESKTTPFNYLKKSKDQSTSPKHSGMLGDPSKSSIESDDKT